MTKRQAKKVLNRQWGHKRSTLLEALKKLGAAEYPAFISYFGKDHRPDTMDFLWRMHARCRICCRQALAGVRITPEAAHDMPDSAAKSWTERMRRSVKRSLRKARCPHRVDDERPPTPEFDEFIVLAPRPHRARKYR